MYIVHTVVTQIHYSLRAVISGSLLFLRNQYILCSNRVSKTRVEMRCRLRQIYVVLVTDSSQNQDYNLMHLTEHSKQGIQQMQSQESVDGSRADGSRDTALPVYSPVGEEGGGG